jgi:hypothetical protein
VVNDGRKGSEKKSQVSCKEVTERESLVEVSKRTLGRKSSYAKETEINIADHLNTGYISSGIQATRLYDRLWQGTWDRHTGRERL